MKYGVSICPRKEFYIRKEEFYKTYDNLDEATKVYDVLVKENNNYKVELYQETDYLFGHVTLKTHFNEEI